MDATERVNLSIAGGAIATSAALAPPVFTVSLVLGAFMEAVSYRALRRSTEAFFAGQGGSWSAGYGLRFGFIALGMTIALAAGAHPVGLVLGLSTVVPAVIIAAFRQPPPEVSAEATVLPPDDPAWDDHNPWLARDIHRDDEEEDSW
ncbi:MAG: hypothetical protein MJE66_11900 [Proteobacteria bacterium]|nr:hypothetical protein [Pseudomonadota bacterium]